MLLRQADSRKLKAKMSILGTNKPRKNIYEKYTRRE